MGRLFPCLLVALVLAGSFAVSLEYDQLTTAPTTIEDKGYVYITFCSRSNIARTFLFTPQGFVASPYRITLDFSGTSTIPDCKQAVVFVSSDYPGMYNLLVEGGSDDWVVPVEFSKMEPLTISLSQSVVYTGYDSVDLRVGGIGDDVWLTIDSSVVGANSQYKSTLPASFPVTFKFSEPGFYEVPINLKYARNNGTVNRDYTLGVRVEEAPVEIKNDLRVPSDGYTNLTVSMELPETIYSGVVSLSSDCLEGSTSESIENFKSGDVVFMVKGSCDPGVYAVNITVGDFQKSVPLHVYGPGGYELFFNTVKQDGKHNMEVIIANEGSQTMKTLSIRLQEGNYRIVREGSFIGDLDFGDYDSAELVFIPNSNPVDVNVKITYAMGGERQEIIQVVPYSFIPDSGNNTFYLFLVLAAAGVWYVRRRRARS